MTEHLRRAFIPNCFQGKKKDGNGSRSGTPTKEVNGKKSKAAAGKRKKESTPTKDGANQPGGSANANDTPAAKKPKIELNLGGSASNTPAASSAQQNTPLSQVDGVSEEAIKRYGIELEIFLGLLGKHPTISYRLTVRRS